MQKCSAWFQACGCSPQQEMEVRTELVAAGMSIASRDRRPFGVVCFQQVDEALLSLLQAAARQSGRVVAVAVGSTGALPAWSVLHAGAADTLAWGTGGKTAEQICVKLSRWSEIDRLVDAALSDGNVVGESAVWLALVRRIVEAARFGCAPILLTGESGTGKEALAELRQQGHPLRQRRPRAAA